MAKPYYTLDHLPGTLVIEGVFGRLYIPNEVIGFTTGEAFEEMAHEVLSEHWAQRLEYSATLSHRITTPHWAVTITHVKNAEDPWLTWVSRVDPIDAAGPNDLIMLSMKKLQQE